MKRSLIKRTMQKIAAIIAIAMLSTQIPASARTDSSFFLLQENPARTNVSVQSLVAGQTAFALDLYGQLGTNQGNLFFSPYSISTCLGMVYAGARGETAHEIARTFHFSAVPTNLPIPMSELEKHLNWVRQVKSLNLNITNGNLETRRENSIELDTANGLWAQDDRKFLPSYLDIVEKYFNGAVKRVNFRTNAEPVRNEINAWVSDKTRDKISGLLEPGAIDSSTRMVLVNAIYFKGTWQNQFEKKNTTNAPFTIARNKKVQVPLMNIEGSFHYADVGHLQVLELPYRGEELENRPQQLSMIVLLPKDVNGLKKLETALNAGSLSNWLAHANQQKVKVSFPRFKMTEKFKLRETLEVMGMEESFSALADFSRMDGRRDLQISEVIHKAYVDVNEEGTEAAAATAAAGIGASLSTKPKPVPVFRADHPFIFLIRDESSGCILFLGRVNDPTAS